MAQITQKGRELASRVYPRVPGFQQEHYHRLLEVCSLLCRHGVTYERIQEVWCNVELTERQEKSLQRREAGLERRMAQLAGEIPMNIRFDGDPRGPVIRLDVSSDDAVQDGIFVA